MVEVVTGRQVSLVGLCRTVDLGPIAEYHDPGLLLPGRFPLSQPGSPRLPLLQERPRLRRVLRADEEVLSQVAVHRLEEDLRIGDLLRPGLPRPPGLLLQRLERRAQPVPAGRQLLPLRRRQGISLRPK